MTLKRDLFRYFERIGRSRPVRELHARPEMRDLVALRHDIDYSIDVALEMAFWEHRAGLRATYYLLDTAPYWQDPRLADKCLQHVDFGHEVGLHLNALAKWYAGEIQDVEADIMRSLDRLRQAGIEVTGVAAHGDPRCYEGGFVNYWCFEELRPDDPAARETGLSAEGIATPDPRHRIDYPDDHRLRRPDGRTFPLWSVGMAGLGLDYDAMHVPMDRYFTDSGGGWTRSPDPLGTSLRRGRSQILIHPIHWRGLPQKTFFLSTARSASTWLAKLIDEATSARGVHEFSLNHRFDGSDLMSAKRTFGDLSTLLADETEVERLLHEARDYMETLAEDWAEANVYLVHFLNRLRKVFPDATLVHLHRDPRDVVNSLVNRGWYETPDDPMHPPVRFEGARAATPFERVCHYVAETNRILLDACEIRVACGAMTTDLGYLDKTFAALGLAFYPRLADPLMGKPLNVGGVPSSVSQWSPEEASAFSDVCGPVMVALGYGSFEPARVQRSARPLRSETRRKILRLGTAAIPTQRERIARLLRGLVRRSAPVEEYPLHKLTTGACQIVSREPLTLRLPAGRHSHLLFGGGTWDKLAEDEGFGYAPGRWFAGEVQLALTDDPAPALYCLSYDGEGQQIDRKLVGAFNRQVAAKPVAFRPRSAAARFNLALYFSAAEAERTVSVISVSLDEVT